MTGTVAKHRGTVVVDTSALYSLVAPFDRSEIDGNTNRALKNHLDILIFLAQQGFNIVIPEIVAVEAANILATGKNINDYFPHSRNRSETRFNDDELIKFLQKVATGKLQNIAILTTNDSDSPSAEYLRELYKIVEHYPSACPQATTALMRVQELKRGRHLGASTIDWLLHDKQSNIIPYKPLFVLTDNLETANIVAKQNKVTHAYDVSILSTKGLMKAVVESKLHTHDAIRMKESVKATDIYDVLTKSKRASGFRDSFKLFAYDVPAGLWDSAEVSFSTKPNSQYHNPFLNNLKELATELDIEEMLERRKRQDLLSTMATRPADPKGGRRLFSDKFVKSADGRYVARQFLDNNGHGENGTNGRS